MKIEFLKIKSILNKAMLAPSGENVQPWRVWVKGNSITLYNDPTADTSLYNFDQRSAFVSHGCFLENLIIAAHGVGLDAETKLFPDQKNSNLVAEITLIPHSDCRNFAHSYMKDLYGSIEKRTTNRKPYSANKINPEVLAALQNIKSISSEKISFHIFENEEDISKLANIGATNEMLVFQNKNIHQYFFKHLTWSDEQEKVSPGFFIKTLELPPPVQLLFKALQHWKIMKVFIKLGLPKLIKKANYQTYKSSPLIIVLATEERRAVDFINIGKNFQRIWLKATSLGLSLQPITGTLFFQQAIEDGASNTFLETEKKEIEKRYSDLSKLLPNTDKNIPIMCRVGYAEKPSAVSSRKPIGDVLISDSNA